MNDYTVYSLFKEVAKLLQHNYSSTEIQFIQRLIFEKKLGLPLHKIYLNPTVTLSDKDVQSILNLVSELKLQKPIQYLLGEADFFGLKFSVTPDVLIPRQETEELVDWIVKENSGRSISILDIGTGSGCIAVSLAHSLKSSKIVAIDISEKAIEVAQKNALQNNTSIQFIRLDILDNSKPICNDVFDVIVSNPPYVRESEKALMNANVLDWEPHNALFVSDSDALLFYRAIAIRSHDLLVTNGKVFCEINEALGHEVKNLFVDYGFVDVEVRKDLNGKDRMLKATLGNGKKR